MIVYIGLKGEFAVLLAYLGLNLACLIYKFVLFFLIDIGPVEVCIAVYPYRQVSEMSLRKSAHIGIRTLFKRLMPLFVCREYIESLGTGHRIIGICRCFLFIPGRICLDENIVVDTVISMKYGHETGHFGPVPDMIRRISGLSLSVNYTVDARIDQSESTQDQVMQNSDTFTGDGYGLPAHQQVVIDQCGTVTYFHEYIGVKHGSRSLLGTVRSVIVMHHVMSHYCSLSFPVKPYSDDAVMYMIPAYRNINTGMKLDTGSLGATQL